MKRIFLILFLFCVSFSSLWSQNIQSLDESNSDSDNQEQVVKYQTNGKGDQFLRLGIMFSIPLNFDEQLYLGGAAQLGYYRLINNWLGFGAELMAGYNPTIGSNIFTYVPITAGIMFQPYIWRFEFPIILSVGMALETSNNKKQFPAFITKAEANIYYRFNESFSLGIGSDIMYMPQWSNDGKSDYNYGIFMTASVSVRYHF